MTGEPGELYELHLDNPRLNEMHEPVLVHALDGFVDAGGAVALAVESLQQSLEHSVLATFATDELIDYRSRRPPLTFESNAFTAYAQPEIALQVLSDEAGTPFLLLSGPEPDVAWERFVAAIGHLIERFGVRLTVGMTAIPMGVPHTRPTGVTGHATRPELIPDAANLFGTVQVPGYLGGLLEYRLGQSGRDALGFAAHVPHYLARSRYPEASRALIQAVADATGLLLPTSSLDEAADAVRTELAEQIAHNSEVAEVVRALEAQYDAFMSERGRGLLANTASLPTADELGAQFEAFLAGRENPGTQGPGGTQGPSLPGNDG